MACVLAFGGVADWCRFIDTRAREAIVAVARICLRKARGTHPSLYDRVISWIRALPYVAAHSQNAAFASVVVDLALSLASAGMPRLQAMLNAAVVQALEGLASDSRVVDSINEMVSNAHDRGQQRTSCTLDCRAQGPTVCVLCAVVVCLGSV